MPLRGDTHDPPGNEEATMSGETEDRTSAWTTDTLREFFLGLLGEHEKRYEQRFQAQEKATVAALDAAEKVAGIIETETRAWRVAQNEWRQAMDDRERKFMPRSEAAVLDQQNALRISNLIDRFDKLEDRVNAREDRGVGTRAAWSAIPILIGVVIAIVGLASRFLGQ